MRLDARPLHVVLLLTAACSSDEPVEATDPVWIPLITREWSLDPGTENTSELQLTIVDEEMWIGGIRPIAPPGTHHTLLAHGGLGSINTIYASGVGTNELTFPAGVALRLAASSLIGLQLHVFNTTESPLSGTSGVEVFLIDPATVEEQADLLLAGPIDLEIPPGETTLSGTCTATEQQTLFALFPHMHQIGTHFKTTLTVGGVERVIHDGPYSFEHQAFLPIEPIVLEPGDTITSECTFLNTGSENVTWGESSTTEMCFSILYRTPSLGGNFCTH